MIPYIVYVAPTQFRCKSGLDATLFDNHRAKIKGQPSLMKRCVFLTMENPDGFFSYDHLVHQPLLKRGWQAEDIPWTTSDVLWDNFQLVVIRSTWDYQNDAVRFLDVLGQIDRSQARLENSLEIVRWNIDKSYLRDLEQRGVAIVPTRWLSGLDREQLVELRRELDADRLVVKPIVGANADDTFCLDSTTLPEQARIAFETFRDRDLLVQPFVDTVVTTGEYSLFYFGGVYSHCVLKTPKPGDFRVQEEHGGRIRAVRAEQDLLDAGQRAIDAIGTVLLYARVDLVRIADGQAAVMELELIEPSLYFPYGPQSPDRFADALCRLV